MRFKNVALMMCMTLLVGAITFSSCKKDKDSLGTKAAKELCDCASKTNETEAMLCTIQWFLSYSDQFDFEMNEESFELDDVKFKDKDFQKDFESELVRCDALRD